MKNIHTLLIGLLVVTAMHCSHRPFVDHKLEGEKISDNCESLKPFFRMVSNIAGERYEFERCLDQGFSTDMLQVSQQGDTVVVWFPKLQSSGVLYKVTLDIDSYPKYSYITIDGETFVVTSSKD